MLPTNLVGGVHNSVFNPMIATNMESNVGRQWRCEKSLTNKCATFGRARGSNYVRKNMQKKIIIRFAHKIHEDAQRRSMFKLLSQAKFKMDFICIIMHAKMSIANWVGQDKVGKII